MQKQYQLDFFGAICAHRFVTAETFFSLERFRAQTRLRYLFTPIIGDALIARARSIAVSQFLKNEYAPYLIFLDDDIVFEPRHLEKLYKDLEEGYDIIGGMYPLKDSTQMASYGWNGNLCIDGNIQEIEYLATGFMGISRRALLKMKDDLELPLLNPNDWATCYPFFESVRCTHRKGGPIYISEDWDFCDKARQCGFNVYLDTGIQLNHIGTKQTTCRDVVEYQKQRDAQVAESNAPSANK